MWRVFVELCVVLGAVGGLGLKVTQHLVQRRVARHRGSPDYEHTKQLLRENEEMDEMLRKMRGEDERPDR